MNRWLWLLAGVAGALVVVGVFSRSRTVPAVTAQQTEDYQLAAGCTNLVLTWPAGTPLMSVATSVMPAASLESIFRLDPGQRRYVGFSPRAPAIINDYAMITSALEPVFICMRTAGILIRPSLRPTPRPAPTPSPSPTPTPQSTPTPVGIPPQEPPSAR